ncbi:MAG TPA: hypothetical protein ENI65_07010 [Gammaproteobacteria bacterium]|nr:hypothetical protein [Gammaproteobacteria bacterium]
MDELYTSMLVIGAEIGLFIGVIFVIYIIIMFKKKKADKSITDEFVNDFKSLSKERKTTLEESLTSAFSLDDGDGKECAHNIMEKEKTICDHVLRIFNGKGRNLILELQNDLNNLTEAYKELGGMSHYNPDDNSDNQEDIEKMEGVIEALQKDNDRLKDDLKKALESVDYLQEQYTVLFDKTGGHNKDN